MAKVYTSINFIRYIYTSKLLPRFKTLSNSMLVKGGVYCSSHVLFTFEGKGTEAYCRLAGSTSTGAPIFKIYLSGGLVLELSGLPQTTPNRTVLKDAVDDIKFCLSALFFHEMGHLLYTDMTSTLISKYKDVSYISFLSNLSNIFEDVYLEKFGLRRDYPVTQKYFKYITAKMFVPQAKAYKDTGNAGSFLQYLLLKLRCPKTLTAKNAVFDSVSSTICPMMSDILHEDNGTERLKKTVALGEWLIANVKLDFKSVPSKPEELPTGGTVGAGSGPAKPGSPMPSGTGSGSSSSGSSASELGGTPSGGSRGQGEVGDSTPTPEQPPVFKTVDELERGLDDEEIQDCYDETNDVRVEDLQDVSDALNSVLSIDDISRHEWVIAKKYFAFGSHVKEAVDKAMLEMNPISLQVIKSLKLFKAQIRPRFTSGFKNGKLDIARAIKSASSGLPTPYLFKQKIARGQAADLAISILCDNSGSMHGNKAHVCTRAMLALAQACDVCGIPIEVNCFTESCGINYTVTMKSFDDKFSDSKYYFGITDSNIYEHYTFDNSFRLFCGNEDEINLYNVWKKFLKNKHKDKLIFVISDGETCGSSADLRNLVNEIKESGVKIIGLGIQSRAVASLYPEYKLFDTTNSLAGLPDYLLETLNSLIKLD